MSENTNQYKLSLEGNGISVCKEVNEEQARRILNILMGPSSMMHPVEREMQRRTRESSNESATYVASSSPQALSLREYLDDVGAKRNPDKILAMAAYIMEQSAAEDFSADEIKNCFPKAAEKVPANYGRDFRWVISSGWAAESHQDQGRFYITKTGRKALAEKFPKELAKPQPGYLKRKKKQQNNS